MLHTKCNNTSRFFGLKVQGTLVHHENKNKNNNKNFKFLFSTTQKFFFSTIITQNTSP